MKIVLINFKGGQGKTSIAINLALTLKMNVVTNDVFTTANMVLQNDILLVVDENQNIPEFKDEVDVIYDFGGHLDLRTANIIKNSDLIIIPIINKFLNNMTSLYTISEVIKINKNILIIVNSAVNKDLEFISNLIKKELNLIVPIKQLRKTTAFEQIVNRKKSLEEICLSSPILAYSYKDIRKEFNDLVDFIKKY